MARTFEKEEQAAARTEAGGCVFYDREDYAGVFRRLAATLVDLAALAAILISYVVMLDVAGIVPIHAERVPGWLLASLLIIVYLYLTLLKRSWVRTPGYWVTGLQVVDLRGRPPSMFRMTLRLFWWVLGPINPLLDLMFMTSDEHRQTLRDKLIGTYVVERFARPAGYGRMSTGVTSFMGMMLRYPVVSPVEGAAPSS